MRCRVSCERFQGASGQHDAHVGGRYLTGNRLAETPAGARDHCHTTRHGSNMSDILRMVKVRRLASCCRHGDQPMAEEHRATRARRLVAGLDDQGRSTFVENGLTRTRLAMDAYPRNQIVVPKVLSAPRPAVQDDTVLVSHSVPPTGGRLP